MGGWHFSASPLWFCLVMLKIIQKQKEKSKTLACLKKKSFLCSVNALRAILT